MPLQEIVAPWDQQPQEAVDIDWGNPLSDALAAVFSNNAGAPRELISGWEPPSGVQWTSEPTKDGLGLYPATTYSGAVGVFLRGGPISVLVVSKPPASESTWRPFFTQRASAGGGQWGFFANSGPTYAVVPGSLTLTSFTNVALTASGAITPDATVFAGVISSTTAGTLYVNGRPLTTTVSGSGYPTIANTLFNIGHHASLPAITNVPMPLILLWNRALTDVEIASISANPWQLFVRREWVPMAAASGGGVTGASSGTLQLAGSAAGSVLVSGASAGALAISGAAAASVRVTGASTGTLSLSGTATGTVGATGVTGQSSQTLSLTGTSTGTVGISGQSAQTLALSGTAAGSVRVTGASAGTLSLTGTATGNTTGAVTGASAGVLSLSGAATGTVRVSGGSAAVLQITGNAGAQIVVRGVSAGVLLMTGGATANNGEPEPLAIRASLSSRTRIRTDGAGTRPAQRSTASRPRQ